MRSPNRMLLFATTAIAVIAISAVVYAESDGSAASMMGGGMMRHEMMGGSTMGQMSRIMGGCDTMMHGGTHSGRPNEQWRDQSPAVDKYD